jgi:RNA polymerase sigma-70 factor (ECF subfamily)
VGCAVETLEGWVAMAPADEPRAIASGLRWLRGSRGRADRADSPDSNRPAGARGDALDEASIQRRVEQAKRGDEASFGELFEAFRGDVVRLCERLLGSRPDAEDAAHETFLRARRGLDGYDPDRRFRPWLLAIASHHALDRIRRRDTERRLFECAEPSPEELASPAPSPLQGELDASLRRRVRGAIDALPDRYRAPLVLRYYADLDHDAIAELCGVSKGQVATLLFRGRRRLRELLAADEPEGSR